MGKRIVFCADGTWQAPLNNTNVFQFYTALEKSPDQRVFYDDGVGADASGLGKVLQGAFGEGLLQKIRDGYTQIAQVFQPGDEIYLFGFSRGAYTVRCLAGMIANCGIPSGTFNPDCVTQAFAAYRDPANRAAILAGLGSCGLGPATIRIVGVWDTVGSLGIPAIFGQVDQKTYGFLDTGLHPDIKNAYHCLAVDEKRIQFPAALWTTNPAPGQTVEQVWFSGCHVDVGGGKPPGAGVDAGTRLSDITLGWMIGKATALGLTLDPATAGQFATLPAKFALDAIHESWTPAMGPQHLRAIDHDASVSNSVAIRIQYGLTYTPNNLIQADGALDDGYQIVKMVDEDAI